MKYLIEVLVDYDEEPIMCNTIGDMSTVHDVWFRFDALKLCKAAYKEINHVDNVTYKVLINNLTSYVHEYKDNEWTKNDSTKWKHWVYDNMNIACSAVKFDSNFVPRVPMDYDFEIVSIKVYPIKEFKIIYEKIPNR